MKRPFSLKRYMLVSFILLFLLMMSGMIVFVLNAARTYVKQARRNGLSVLELYRNELLSDMDALESLNQSLYTDNYNFQALSAGHETAPQKVVYEYNLRTLIRERTPRDGAILVFRNDQSTSFYCFGSSFTPEETIYCRELKDELVESILTPDKDNGEFPLYTWILYTSREGVSFLVNTYQLSNMYVCSLIDLSRVTAAIREENQQYSVLFYNHNSILTNADEMESLGISIDLLNHSPTNLSEKLQGLRFLSESLPVGQDGIFMASILSMEDFIRGSLPSILIFAIVTALLLAGTLIIYHSFSRVLVYPVNQIAGLSEQLARGVSAENIHAAANSRISEIHKIADALNHLLHQKIVLQKEAETEQAEKEHAQLQYLQLQTRSHFFLNCLKSLYNMLELKEYSEMKRMILAFSNHIRFVFHDNLSFIPLNSELNEVNDYCSIIRMDHSKPIILIQRVNPDTGNIQVPPLIIQTFLENTIKYSGKEEQALQFVIEAGKVNLDNEEYLRIRLTDNGKGFDAETLNELNQSGKKIYAKDHVGINNLTHRMDLLYKGRGKMMFMNSEKGGACVLIYLPVLGQNGTGLSQ